MDKMQIIFLVLVVSIVGFMMLVDGRIIQNPDLMLPNYEQKVRNVGVVDMIIRKYNELGQRYVRDFFIAPEEREDYIEKYNQRMVKSDPKALRQERIVQMLLKIVGAIVVAVLGFGFLEARKIKDV
ncbi:MAG: hypothetical protein MOGMAGMI_00218 [Candidatus Omnitrophica bacterium]|nr:hypothetical protein [Candidatus Omnitrophota bacterium]